MNDFLSLPINEQYQIDEDFLDGPAPTPPSLPSQSNSWPPQLIFDLALGLDSYEDIGLRHNLTEQQITKLYSHPLFRREVAIMTRELQESNAIFRNKAKVQAESYLETMDDLMHDPDTPAATKLSIFQALTKLGDLEPEPKQIKSQLNSLTPEGATAGRITVEWVGGQKDHSPVAIEGQVITDAH